METCHQTGCSNPAVYYAYFLQLRLCRECFKALIKEGAINPGDFKLMH